MQKGIVFWLKVIFVGGSILLGFFTMCFDLFKLLDIPLDPPSVQVADADRGEKVAKGQTREDSLSEIQNSQNSQDSCGDREYFFISMGDKTVSVCESGKLKKIGSISSQSEVLGSVTFLPEQIVVYNLRSASETRTVCGFGHIASARIVKLEGDTTSEECVTTKKAEFVLVDNPDVLAGVKKYETDVDVIVIEGNEGNEGNEFWERVFNGQLRGAAIVISP
jgi:hypothetical protein